MNERPPLIVDVVLDPPFTVECPECGRDLQVVISVRMESKLAQRITSLKELCARAAEALRVDYKLDHLQESLINELKEAAK